MKPYILANVISYRKLAFERNIFSHLDIRLLMFTMLVLCYITLFCTIFFNLQPFLVIILQTPVIHALGVVLQDSRLYPQPHM